MSLLIFVISMWFGTHLLSFVVFLLIGKPSNEDKKYIKEFRMLKFLFWQKRELWHAEKKIKLLTKSFTKFNLFFVNIYGATECSTVRVCLLEKWNLEFKPLCLLSVHHISTCSNKIYNRLFECHVMSRCRAVVDDVGDHALPQQSVLWNPDELCWADFVLPCIAQTV